MSGGNRMIKFINYMALNLGDGIVMIDKITHITHEKEKDNDVSIIHLCNGAQIETLSSIPVLQSRITLANME